MAVHALVMCSFCFELLRMQNCQNFLGLWPWTPLGKGLQQPHRLPNCTKAFLLTTLVQNPAPPKIDGYGTERRIASKKL